MPAWNCTVSFKMLKLAQCQYYEVKIERRREEDQTVGTSGPGDKPNCHFSQL